MHTLTKKVIVYRLISPSGKSYIGLTSRSYLERFQGHLNDWKYGRGCKKLYAAFDKYAPFLWSHEILFKTENIEEAKSKEVELIKEFNCIENGYNICYGGQLNRLGIKHTDETKLKMSKIKRGVKLGPQRQETIDKRISKIIGKKKKPFSDLARKNMSLAHIGKPANNKGIPHTKEARLKIGLALKGKILSNEHKYKISINHRKYQSEETRKKISASRILLFKTKKENNLTDGE